MTLKRIPYDKPVLFFGNIRDLFLQKVTLHEFMKSYYMRYNNSNHSICGLYVGRLPVYQVMDFNLTKDICNRDFDHFMDRVPLGMQSTDILADLLLLSPGPIWKPTRAMVSPAFSSGKLKAMDVVIQSCGEKMSQHLLKRENPDKEIEMKQLFGIFTLDVLTNCIFGIDSNPWKELNSELIAAFYDCENYSILTHLKMNAAYWFFPENLRRFLKVSVLADDSVYFAANIIRNAREYRLTNNQRRNDFLQLLIDNAAKEEVKKPENRLMDEKHILSQSILFILAGFKTTATLLKFVSYELAVNPEIQNTLRAEIKSVLEKHNNVLNYDTIQEMPYLEMVLLETLRKHPPIPRFDRCCIKDYKVRGIDLVIEKGTMVYFSIIGFHHDPRYFPNPEKFNPLRFQENRNPHGFFVFGSGPRNCIGQKFALIVAKYAMVYILKDFGFFSTNKTQVPVLGKNGNLDILIHPKM
ncbi:cytochrome P450 6k1-like [Chrysoperla carnea]|uniref:cytochrome P450 6k1-like n=1 Tax=Chrysoperla carnea TaxID=189513 RepID=UPI001D06CA60|nr:cytochrome P450 6k1-like [Chrysoperla carnea]